MRSTYELIDPFRKTHPVVGGSTGSYGYFQVPTVGGKMNVISSGSFGEDNDWEHVSVSLPNRCPSWNEMCRVKELFWSDEETVIQFHPAKSDYINDHPFCLHLWRHRDGHEMPPKEFV